ncbi:hypothetical protein GTP91_15425 [Rugamonas sp. FT82W]|uniref:Uncharacterized protein n=1 Tax=Duganella vulcania TaxID=2692166 RepID=A0A845G6R9_9BURK|nr:hypothetical protein [Duganella vulcania]MYM88559.1 hypothetical protein [Duganella vulcania]
MQGHNKAFMADPYRFLLHHPLRIQARTDQNSPLAQINAQASPPVFDFDLRPSGDRCMELIPFSAHTKTNFFGTQRPIRAYWLDYQPERICTISGDMKQADYLFTPMLSGCYVGGGPTGMVHIAGDFYNEALRRFVPPVHQRDNASMRLRAMENLNGSLTIAFDSNQNTSAAEMTLVGVRSNTGWMFYVQGHTAFSGNAATLASVYNETNHQTVIPIRDLRRG